MDNINLNRENGQKLWAADWNKLISTINLIIDAVNNQSNLPGITKLSQLINDSGFITQEDVKGKVNKGELAEVATSGSYNDLKDKPSQMTGPQGPEGKSAYQVAVLNGFIGTPQLWLNSLKGEDGLPGLDGQDGLDGENGLDGRDGLNGSDGKSAYELAVEEGYEGTLELWLESLHGQDGQGADETLDANGHDYVEIEGVKWATMNVGALNIYDIGTSFGSDPEITDKASSWGGDWRSPTKEEFYSLMLLCRMVQATINNVEGVKFIYKKDPSITLFFPRIEVFPYRTKINESIVGSGNLSSEFGFFFKDKYVKTIECFTVTSYSYGGLIRPVLRKYDDSSKLLYRPTVVDRECDKDDGYGGMSIYNDELAINWNGHKNSAYRIYKNKWDVLFFMSKTISSKYYNAGTGESSNNISNIIVPSYNYDSVYQKFYDEFGGDWELPQKDDLLLLLLKNKITVNWDEEYFTIGDNTKRYFLDYKLYDADTGEETEYRGFVGADSSLEIDTTSSKRVFINSGAGIIGKTIGIVHCSTPQTLILSEVSVSGDYNDLKNLPFIPDEQILSDWNQTDNTQVDYIKNKPNLATVATTNKYSDLYGTPSTFEANNHQYVEIAGIKWATMNIGASSVTSRGLYFQWADVQGATVNLLGTDEGEKCFDWVCYKYGNGKDQAEFVATKYGEVDNKTVLDIDDDIAHANWGGSWRMPTMDEYAALGAAVDAVWTDNYQNSGVSGLICTDKTDNSKIIFFPATNACYSDFLIEESLGFKFADYLSNSRYAGNDKTINCFHFDGYYSERTVRWNDTAIRAWAGPVRGVLDETRVFSKVAFTGDYSDLTNKPAIPANQIQADWSLDDTSAVDYIKNKPYSVTANNVVYGGYTFVDLGLPSGTLWATKNIGEDQNSTGDYFRMAEITPYDPNLDTGSYLFSTHRYIDSDIDNVIPNPANSPYLLIDSYLYHYFTNDNYLGEDNNSYLYLNSSEDAATLIIGDKCKIPTQEQIDELLNNTVAVSGDWRSGITLLSRLNGNDITITAKTIIEDKQLDYLKTYSGTPYFYILSNKIKKGYETENTSTIEGYNENYIYYLPQYTGSSILYYDNNYSFSLGNTLSSASRFPNAFLIRPVLLSKTIDLATVATSGSYNDLNNKPTIPAAQIQADWNQTDNTALDYIKNKPTIPASSGTSTQIQADWDLSDSTALDYIKNKPTIPAAQIQSDWNATTGMGVILNKPTIPTVPGNETATSGGNTLSVVTTGDKYNWNNKANVWQGTQVQYDALSPNYDSNTIYIITES